MSPFHLPSTSRALYRVFIAPNLANSRTAALLPAIFKRTKSYQKKDTARHAITDYYVLDTAIPSPFVNLVLPPSSRDPNAPTLQQVSVSDVLASIDRTKEYLCEVSPGKYNEFGQPDRDNLPICKIIPKIDLRTQLQKKLDIERRQAKGQSAGIAPKTLELNWAIAGGDLKHRLLKLQQFLSEGRKVELTIGPKLKGRVATVVECTELLAKVRGAVGEVKGAGEIKEPEGKMGGVMLLVFEGSKAERERRGRDKAEEKEKNRRGGAKEKGGAVAGGMNK